LTEARLSEIGSNEAGVGNETAGFSAAEFFARSRQRLGFAVPPGLFDRSILPVSGDLNNARILQSVIGEQPVRPAAVLIPVVDHEEPTVLLTRRAAHLNSHAGQVAFPGGKIDDTDAAPVDTALRETEEEVGLGREFVEPIGYLDLYATAFGFRVVPTLAIVRPGFELKINHCEVEDAFEVPLSFLMDPANHQLHSRNFRGVEGFYYAMPYDGWNIWGATAGMLRMLYERIWRS